MANGYHRPLKFSEPDSIEIGMREIRESAVPRVRTPLSDEELRAELITCYRSVFGCEIPPRRLAVLWAVLALEHGAGADGRAPANGRAAWNLWCWDLGNRRGGVGDAGYFVMTADENQGGHNVPITGRWPAFSSAEAGMASWLLLLKSRYRLAWAASLTGNATAYATAAKAGGYYTAPVATYAAGVATWLRIYWKR